MKSDKVGKLVFISLRDETGEKIPISNEELEDDFEDSVVETRAESEGLVAVGTVSDGSASDGSA